MKDTSEVVDGRASGFRGVMVCTVVGFLCLASVAGSQAFGWGQVTFEETWEGALLLSTISYWTNVVGIFAATLGVVALTARRTNWGLFVVGLTFVGLMFSPARPATIVLLVVGGLVAIQIGFFLGDVERLVRLRRGAAQAISNGVFVTGIPLATAGFAWLADRYGPGSFVVLAVIMMAAGLVGLYIFPAETRPPSELSYGDAFRERFRESWTPRTFLGFVISGLSAGAVGAHLLPLPTTLARAGYPEPEWLLLAGGTLVPAGIAVIIIWSKVSGRWRDSGLRLAAWTQVAGIVVLGVAPFYQGAGFLAIEIVGLLILNAAREAYSASLFANVGVTPQSGAVLVAGLVGGYALAAWISALAVTRLGGFTGPAITAAVFALACLALTVGKTPTADGGYLRGRVTEQAPVIPAQAEPSVRPAEPSVQRAEHSGPPAAPAQVEAVAAEPTHRLGHVAHDLDVLIALIKTQAIAPDSPGGQAVREAEQALHGATQLDAQLQQHLKTTRAAIARARRPILAHLASDWQRQTAAEGYPWLYSATNTVVLIGDGAALLTIRVGHDDWSDIDKQSTSTMAPAADALQRLAARLAQELHQQTSLVVTVNFSVDVMSTAESPSVGRHHRN